ncbi:hypothetical protein HDU79_008970 [Rhizoclosmatium sp. JEL0117]|nr:hypothetical protein HDU79_008970 [Rhizoclosmatium sp. JEL0117]
MLSTLPPELLFFLFSKLAPDDLLQILRVNRQFRVVSAPLFHRATLPIAAARLFLRVDAVSQILKSPTKPLNLRAKVSAAVIHSASFELRNADLHFEPGLAHTTHFGAVAYFSDAKTGELVLQSLVSGKAVKVDPTFRFAKPEPAVDITDWMVFRTGFMGSKLVAGRFTGAGLVPVLPNPLELVYSELTDPTTISLSLSGRDHHLLIYSVDYSYRCKFTVFEATKHDLRCVLETSSLPASVMSLSMSWHWNLDQLAEVFQVVSVDGSAIHSLHYSYQTGELQKETKAIEFPNKAYIANVIWSPYCLIICHRSYKSHLILEEPLISHISLLRNHEGPSIPFVNFEPHDPAHSVTISKGFTSLICTFHNRIRVIDLLTGGMQTECLIPSDFNDFKAYDGNSFGVWAVSDQANPDTLAIESSISYIVVGSDFNKLN